MEFQVSHFYQEQLKAAAAKMLAEKKTLEYLAGPNAGDYVSLNAPEKTDLIKIYTLLELEISHADYSGETLIYLASDNIMK